MIRIDLDDLPPKVAQMLTAAEAGEEILLLQGGVVAGRLVGGAAPAPEVDEDEPLTDEQRAAEVFEQFRSAIEDEF